MTLYSFVQHVVRVVFGLLVLIVTAVVIASMPLILAAACLWWLVRSTRAEVRS